MRQTWLACALTTLLLGGCNDNNSDTATPTPTPTPDPVLTASLAMGKTAGGKNEDIALWLAKSDSEASRLYTVDKKSGLEVYSLQSGALLHTQDDDLDNEGSTGVDVRYNSFGHDVLAVSNNSGALLFYSISADAAAPASLGKLDLDFEPAGVCLYRPLYGDQLHAITFDEAGQVQQWKLKLDNGALVSAITGEDTGAPAPVRTLQIGGEISGCVVDDEKNQLYLAEGATGIWRYGADPETGLVRQMVDAIGLGELEEVEDVGLFIGAEGTGYLLAADNSKGIQVYDRKDGKWLTTLTVAASSGVDAVEEYNGVTSGPTGLLIEDDKNSKLLTLSSVAGISKLEWQAKDLRALSQSGVDPIYPVAETPEMDDDGDAADDPAIWLNPQDADKSLVIGTNKQAGLLVYGLDGSLIQQLDDGEMNNVDLRDNVALGSDRITLVAATNRSSNTVALYALDNSTPDSPLTKLTATGSNTQDGELLSAVDEVYGLCLYQDDVATYVYLNGKDGHIEQWQIGGTAKAPTGEKVRTLSVASQPEGCVADDASHTLYVGEEDVGIWSFDARATGASTATSIDKVGKGNLTADVEGLTVYADGSRKWLIASSQGDNSYAVYDMNDNHKVLGRFALLANDSAGVDGTMDTDGIAAASGNLGSLYPQGIFVAQDFNNVDSGYSSENQNFKFASMAEIISAVEAK